MIDVEAARDEQAVRARAAAVGFSADGAARFATRLVRVVAALEKRGHDHVRVWWVPGRIEVLGKHTDYAGGESLVAAIEHGFVFAGAPRSDRRIELTAVGRGETMSMGCPDAGPAWRRYPEAAWSRLAGDWAPDAGLDIGFDLAFESDLPPAAGLSSSTSLITGTVLAAVAFADLDARDTWRVAIPTVVDFAAYLGAIESGASFGGFAGDAGVGTEGGAQDSTAICCATPGAISHFRYAPTASLGAVPLPPDLVFVVGSSGVVAEKTGAARDRYNRASRLAAEAAAHVRAQTGGAFPHLGGAVASLGPDGVRAAVAPASAAVRQRVDHFLAESGTYVPAARAAFAAGAHRDLGAAVASSVTDAERWLDNQIPETVALTELAVAEGAVAASPFGAGYGGSVWALVRRDAARTFTSAWQAAYRTRFPEHRSTAGFFATESGPAAFELTIR